MAADGAAGPAHAHLRLRWLRARQFQPAAALEAWRKEVRARPAAAPSVGSIGGATVLVALVCRGGDGL